MSFITKCAVIIAIVLVLGGTLSSCNRNSPLATVSPTPSNRYEESQTGPRYIRKSDDSQGVIIFMHGFTSDSISSWTNPDTGAYWPELLAEDSTFNEYNIYVYEYDTSLFNERRSIDEITEDVRLLFDSDQITDYPEVIFLVHSMGGIITRAYLNKYRSVAERVNFIYFFATPTTGSHVANIAKVFINNAQIRQLTAMTSESYLADVERQWLAANHDIDSYCAYELLPTNGVLIVNIASATGLCTEPLDPLNKTHIDIVKPANTRDRSYLAFKNAFQKQLTAKDDMVSTVPSTLLPSTTSAASTAVPAPDMYIQQESFRDNIYLVSLVAGATYTIGTQLVVYGEISPGVPIAIGLLRVTQVNPTTLSSQAILIHPNREIRPNLRVDTNLQYLLQSELVPAADIAIGYLLSVGRVYLRPNSNVNVGDTLEALEPDIAGGEIIDYLPFDPPIKVRVTAVGFSSRVARVELTEGEWPDEGTILRLIEAETPVISPGETATAVAVLTISAEDGYKLAAGYMQSGNYLQAIPLFKHVIALQPDNVNALYNLGVCYLKTEEYEQGIVSFEDFIRQAPAHAKVEEAHYNLGVIYRALEESALAKEQFMQIGADSALYTKAQKHLDELSSRE